MRPDFKWTYQGSGRQKLIPNFGDWKKKTTETLDFRESDLLDP